MGIMPAGSSRIPCTTNMKHLLFIIVLLLACFDVSAQRNIYEHAKDGSLTGVKEWIDAGVSVSVMTEALEVASVQDTTPW